MINMAKPRTALNKVPEPGCLIGVLPVGRTSRIGMLNNYIEPSQNFIAWP